MKMKAIIQYFHDLWRKLYSGSPSQDNKINYLESLRGLAAAAVVFHHYSLLFYPAASWGVIEAGDSHNVLFERLFYGLPFGFMKSGTFAVVLFFVLSGFVLTRAYFSNHNIQDLTKQAVKRYFRLLFPVLATVFLAYILMTNNLLRLNVTGSLTGSEWALDKWNFVPSFLNALYDGVYGVFIDGEAKYNANLWTMKYEFFGSFLVFSVAALFGRHRNRAFIYAALVVILWQSFYLPFIVGLVIADIFSTENGIKKRIFALRPTTKLMLFVTGLVLASMPAQGDINQTFLFKSLVYPTTNPMAVIILWHTIGSALLMIILLSSKKLQSAMNLRFFVFLGKISFSLYLLHMYVLATFSAVVFNRLYESIGFNFAVLVSGLLSVPVLILSSWIWHQIIDAPTVKFSREIGERFFKKDSVRLEGLGQ
jgi:peptidoglycan/LPS O-acetylase OafA/YrhL